MTRHYLGIHVIKTCACKKDNVLTRVIRFSELLCFYGRMLLLVYNSLKGPLRGLAHPYGLKRQTKKCRNIFSKVYTWTKKV